jgi:beta-lactamase class A
LTVAAVGILAGGGLVGVGLLRDGDGGRVPAAGTFESASPKPGGPSAAEVAAQKERAKRVAQLDTALTRYAATKPEFSVAVLDRRTGKKYSYRGAEAYETASIVKVQVLACLLLTAQDGKRELTASETGLATRMIHASDNDATTALFNRLGRQTAIGACNKRLGLTRTKVNKAWGLTRTTVDDQVRLLAELVDPKGPLDQGSRQKAYDLMSTVNADQDWGVTAAAAKGEKRTVKNGWLARSADDNRWIINSVGRVTDGDTDVSIAVLTHDNTTMPGGISLVEKVAKMTRQYLKY